MSDSGEFRKLWRAVKCKQNCLGISSSGDESLFLNQQGQWVDSGSGSALTFDNALTKTLNNVELGGNLLQNTTIETSTFDFLKQEVVSNIKEGIYNNLISSNRSWNAEHTDNNTTFLITNKVENVGDPFSTDFNAAGTISINNVNGHICANIAGVDNNSGDIFAEMVYIIDTYTTALRLDNSGLRVNFNYSTVFSVKPTGIINMVVPEYADNAEALAAGLVAGDLYKTGGNSSTFICIVV